MSVIVPTRNRASYLDDCLQSLSTQECSCAYEVVVVDNASTDHTPQLISQWCSDHRFRAAHETSIGLSKAKNAGASVARGALLLFTDDDVIVDSRWIDSYARFFESRSGELLLAGGPIIPIPPDLRSWPGWIAEGTLPDLGLLHHGAKRPLVRYEWLFGANMALPAVAFHQLGGWNENLGRRGDERGTFEDIEYQERLQAAGGAVWFCPDALVRHRISREAVTPRRVLATAFWRGANERRTGNPRAEERLPRVERPALALLWHLASWTLWSVLFRISGASSAFKTAHRSAWSSGWVTDKLRDGRESALGIRALCWIALFVRKLASRAAGL